MLPSPSTPFQQTTQNGEDSLPDDVNIHYQNMEDPANVRTKTPAEDTQNHNRESKLESQASIQEKKKTQNGCGAKRGEMVITLLEDVAESSDRKRCPPRVCKRLSYKNQTKYGCKTEAFGEISQTTIFPINDRRGFTCDSPNGHINNRQEKSNGKQHTDTGILRVATIKTHHHCNGGYHVTEVKRNPAENIVQAESFSTRKKIGVRGSPQFRLSTGARTKFIQTSSSTVNVSAVVKKGEVAYMLMDNKASVVGVGNANGPRDPTTPEHTDKKWLSPQEVVQKFGSSLTDYEKKEILSYKKIWYFGSGAAKSSSTGDSYNNGFDNKCGEYKTVLHDHIAYRYELIKTIGKGAFGEVLTAFDHREQRHVALKIIRNRPNLHEQAKVEVQMLRTVEKRDPLGKNFTLRIFDDFTFRNHPCIVFEHIGANLYEVLKRNEFRGFPVRVIRKMCRCVLKCLAILSDEDIVHCDLKPENILIVPGNKPYVKLIDFGSSCKEPEQIYNYIQSRYYRAPEVILGLRYTKLIDMWSLGCVVAELYTGEPLFPGKDENDQLRCIAELLGEPPASMLQDSTVLGKMSGA
ncbi:unnamed protein product [Mesocestoides corti]|uniref:dual-specificity kinase n=1 Tax=Mesocestoides corti TaxID=53468 RepID=A0A0R3UGD0_MESCO|nr:unnamed protein product [Mesocestoides corti]